MNLSTLLLSHESDFVGNVGDSCEAITLQRKLSIIIAEYFTKSARRNLMSMNDMAIEPLDPDVVAARAFVTEVGVAALTGGKTSVPLQALVALVEKVVKERHIIASQWAHAVKACGLLKEERDALLKPHNSDGTITCPECHKSMGGDGLVEAMKEALAAQKEAEEPITHGCGHAETIAHIRYFKAGFCTACVFSLMDQKKEAEERLKEAHVWRCDCEMDDPKSSDNDCIELRTRTETKA
jgi:hypothetical protein